MPPSHLIAGDRRQSAEQNSIHTPSTAISLR
jgi:hypothetical protein